MDDDLERIREFDREIREKSSTKVEPFDFGTAYFNSDYPISYSHNFLFVDRAPESISATELADIADRLQGGAGLSHRTIWVENDELGTRLNREFEALDWSWREHLVVMILRREPDRIVDTTMVEEVSYEQIRPALIEITSREPWADSDDTTMALVDRRKVTARATNLRHFVVRLEGKIASMTDLYSDGRTAQIEDVGTFAEYRERGYARAVVSGALQVATSERHDLIWIVADDNDWPKELYEKVGFDPIDRYWEFTRPGDDSRRDETLS